jgi:hypothetical protein
LVDEVKDWNVILRQDNKKTNELKTEYQKLKKEFKELKKLPYTKEKQERIAKLLDNIKIKLNMVKQLDDKQKKLVKYYSTYHFVKFFT